MSVDYGHRRFSVDFPNQLALVQYLAMNVDAQRMEVFRPVFHRKHIWENVIDVVASTCWLLCRTKEMQNGCEVDGNVCAYAHDSVVYDGDVPLHADQG